jgi:hypothetical protein
MSNQYWLLYEFNDLEADGPFSDIHRVRDLAVSDASDNGCKVQIHKGDLTFCEWNGNTLVEEW